MSENRESTGGGAVVVDPLGGLVLDPSNELKFRGPFDDYVSVSLTIRNPTAKRIAFKIKTTAPKRYCVKPNSGVLDPDQNIKVNVLLQPFIYDPTEKNKHKFMVQYMYLNESEMQYNVNDILNIWKDVPASRLLDLKLKCIFELTETDQQRIQTQQQQQQQQTAPAENKSSNNNNNDAAIKNAKSTSSVSSSSFSKDTYVAAASDFDSTHHVNTTSSNKSSAAGSNASSPVVSTVGSVSSSTSSTSVNPAVSSRVDKHDNTLNELKMLRQECETLKRENIRLKEEEARLRKLALQAPSSTLHKGPPADALTDLLNNRSTLIIIVLLAIVVYLLLFR